MIDLDGLEGVTATENKDQIHTLDEITITADRPAHLSKGTAWAVFTVAGTMTANDPSVRTVWKTSGKAGTLGKIFSAAYTAAIFLKNLVSAGLVIKNAEELAKARVLESSGRIEDLNEKQLEKAKRSHEKLIDEHEQKLKDYEQDPDAHDNQGRLRDAKSPEQRQERIDGRKDALRKQIKKTKRKSRKNQ